MRGLIIIIIFVLVSSPCWSKPTSEVEEASVVSVYTTLPTTSGTLDVYHQIANNIAERITSPIYQLFGLNRTSSEENKSSTTNFWDKIEILDDEPFETNKSEIIPVDNDISEKRDVEELSVEALRRTDKKPEKIVFYSSKYLPADSELNDESFTIKDIDDEFFPEYNNNREKSDRNGFNTALEWVTNVLSAAWETIKSFFLPGSSR